MSRRRCPAPGRRVPPISTDQVRTSLTTSQSQVPMLAACSASRLRSSLASSVAWLASRSLRAWRSPSRAPSRASAGRWRRCPA